MTHPEGPSTQYLKSLVPNTIESMAFGTRNLKYWLLGSSGSVSPRVRVPIIQILRAESTHVGST